MRDSVYGKYAVGCKYEPQSIYLQSNCSGDLISELKDLGTRRILLICQQSVMKYRSVQDLRSDFVSGGFFVCDYSRREADPAAIDINGGIDMFREFNCDTVVSVGQTPDADCGKLIAALAANPGKKVSDFRGINKVKRDITVLCHVALDNSPSPSTAFAHYRDEDTGRMEAVYSSYMVPQIVVYDTDISMRISMAESLDTACYSLSMAIESYLDPEAELYPEYRAGALNSVLSLLSNMEKMKNNPVDPYIRQTVAVAGFYAGMSSRITGEGLSSMISREVYSRYGRMSGITCLRITAAQIEVGIERYKEDVAVLGKSAHLCTKNCENTEAAIAFIDNLLRICDRLDSSFEIHTPSVPAADMPDIADAVRKEMADFFPNRLSTDEIKRILTSVFSGHEGGVDA